jgi:hypothetical protein
VKLSQGICPRLQHQRPNKAHAGSRPLPGPVAPSLRSLVGDLPVPVAACNCASGADPPPGASSAWSKKRAAAACTPPPQGSLPPPASHNRQTSCASPPTTTTNRPAQRLPTPSLEARVRQLDRRTVGPADVPDARKILGRIRPQGRRSLHEKAPQARRYRRGLVSLRSPRRWMISAATASRTRPPSAH